jgi:amino acid adenylation domain-containing protein
VIGLGVAGQAMTGQTSVVGHCVNLLPVRTRLQADVSFQENLETVKNGVLDAYDHHQSTLGRILQHLRVPRSPSRPPLVEVIFNLDKDPGAAEFYGVEFDCERNPKRALHFDLFFNFVEGPRSFYVECDYNRDLFDASTIERWLKHYQTLLEGICANSEETLGKLPILTHSELRELTVEWNQTGVQFPKQRALHEWFEDQVTKTPDARALTFEGRHWTYDELNRRANQVAHYLKGLGVGPDVLVGLFLERSPEIVIGILGILKAGGAYLPIDPVYPNDRLAFMIEDASVAVLLTQSTLARELPRLRATVVRFDTDQAQFDGQPESNPELQSTPDNLAYVIYTSGSTGAPKGSLVTHYNVVRLMQATESWYRFNEDDVWTFFHSHAFDFSVWELWGALLYGGRLVMVPYVTSRSPRDFYLLLASEGVTVLNQTPSAFRQLIEAEAALGGGHDLALRSVIFGGEALEMGSLRPWFDRHGDQKPLLVNMYGITETTVHVTYRPLSIADLSSGSVIGVPIPDLQVYILDQYQRPVPIGVRGEIYVGGAGVAAGYLNREEVTALRFMPDSFADTPGGLLYRSGDLGRFLPNRDIEYFGRIDNQVKIRGFRIETGEIEAVLSRHPMMRQCLVVAREDTPGDKTLAAYLELRANYELDLADLRAHLKKHLPDYMIPSAFIPMETFPLTPNGKIDRNMLPAPSYENRQTADQFVAPRTETEKALATIWAQILKVERIGLHDNFFDLGGHSLLAVRVASQIRDVFGVDLAPRAFFANPTIGDLAKAVGEAQGCAGTVHRIERRNPSAPAPLSFAQERIWFLDRLAPGSPAYNIVDVIRLEGAYNAEALKQAVRELVRRHEILRTAFVITDGQPMQVILPMIELALPELDLTAFAEPEREAEWTRVVRENGRKSFDLAEPPLLRCTVVRRPGEHLLLLTIHHIIADEWSMEVLHFDSTGAANPVRGFCHLAAELAAGRCAPKADLVLEARAGGEPVCARTVYRQASSSGAELPRRNPNLRIADGRVRASEVHRTPGASHPVHDPVGGLYGTDAPLHRPG